MAGTIGAMVEIAIIVTITSGMVIAIINGMTMAMTKAVKVLK